MARCDELAACSEEAERITRPFASPAMKTAQELVGRWILQAGMNASRDHIGNVRGRYEAAAPGGPTLLMETTTGVRPLRELLPDAFGPEFLEE